MTFPSSGPPCLPSCRMIEEAYFYDAKLVGQPGLECGQSERAASTKTARDAAKIESVAFGKSRSESTVLDTKTTPAAQAIDPDAALRAAITAALEAGDLTRAETLIGVLRGAQKPVAPVIAIANGRRR